MKQVIYNEKTKEEYSEEYFLDHVENLPFEERNKCLPIYRYIRDRRVGKEYLHIDTYLKDNIWRCQIAVCWYVKAEKWSSSMRAHDLAYFINKNVADLTYRFESGVDDNQNGFIYYVHTIKLKYK